MSTRSRIGLRADDDSVVSIYTHNDGYPSHHAPILLDRYDTKAKVKALLALGDLSILTGDLGVKQIFDAPRPYPFAERMLCLAYGRDRGDTDCEAFKSPSVEAFEETANDCCAEYIYLFDGFVWWISEGADTWEPLAP